MWGPPQPTHLVKIDHIYVRIRQNLWDFFTIYAGDHSLDRYLWTDQICINQAETLEKNAQVSVMGSIYQGATQVIAWPGHPADGSDTIIQLIRGYHQARQEAMRWSLELEDPEVIQHRLLSESDDVALEARLEHSLKQNYKSVMSFVHRPYGHRLWILQEILLAKDVQLHGGGETCSAWDLCAMFTLSIFRQRRGPNFSWHPLHEPPDTRSPEMVLARAVRKSAAAQCEDTRDKIFGLVSFVREGDRPTVDYELSIDEVFLEAGVSMYGNSIWGVDRSKDFTIPDFGAD